MIIFGSRTTTAFLAALIFQCAFCHSPAAQRLFRVRSWFTLFFLPIFPFGHGNYQMTCSYCGQASTLSRENAERFVADAHAQQHGAPAPYPMPPQQAPRSMGQGGF
ncbi:zinc ribbon domain-containing protein [Gordonia sp. CPCC 205515]|uniref:zinc-ribbon domain-containing protein n=1 Tax=Gordonia sp. CPCC 205515 TaxID=3140791 RepID=UPI003AF3F8EE